MDSPHEEPPSGPSKRRRTTTPLEDFPDDDDIWASLGFAGPPPLCLRVLIVDGLIVGARYYLGQVVVSEALGFTRDPDNEHDSNAICVDNSSGCQVGHLPRYWAAVLAPLIDTEELQIEGYVTEGSDGYKIAILLELFALRGQETSTLQDLEGLRIHDRGIATRQFISRIWHRPDDSCSTMRTLVMPISPPPKTLNRERLGKDASLSRTSPNRPVKRNCLNSPPVRSQPEPQIVEFIEDAAASPTSDADDSRMLSASSDHTATAPSSDEPEDCGCSRCHLDDLRSEFSWANPQSDTAQAAFIDISQQLNQENVARIQQGLPGLQEDQRNHMFQDRCEEWIGMRYFEWRMREFPCVPDSQEDEDGRAEEVLILDAKPINGRLFYLVRWRGYPDDSDTWEPLAHIDAGHLVYEYHRRHANKLMSSQHLDGRGSELSEAC